MFRSFLVLIGFLSAQVAFAGEWEVIASGTLGAVIANTPRAPNADTTTQTSLAGEVGYIFDSGLQPVFGLSYSSTTDSVGTTSATRFRLGLLYNFSEPSDSFYAGVYFDSISAGTGGASASTQAVALGKRFEIANGVTYNPVLQYTIGDQDTHLNSLSLHFLRLSVLF